MGRLVLEHSMGFADFWNTPQNRLELSWSKSLLPSWFQFMGNLTHCILESCSISSVYLIDWGAVSCLLQVRALAAKGAIAKQNFSS